LLGETNAVEDHRAFHGLLEVETLSNGSSGRQQAVGLVKVEGGAHGELLFLDFLEVPFWGPFEDWPGGRSLRSLIRT
jgi:hypothetical protein